MTDEIETLRQLVEDLHIAITIEPTGLTLSREQCINLYDPIKALLERVERLEGWVDCYDTYVREVIKDIQRFENWRKENALEGGKVEE